MIQIARVVQFGAAVLAAYGASYGPHPSNLVFVAGVGLVLLLTFSIFARERNALRAVWPALLGFALLFAISGLPTLGRPDCTGAVLDVGCVNPVARLIEVAAIALVFGAVALAVIDWRRSSITAA